MGKGSKSTSWKDLEENDLSPLQVKAFLIREECPEACRGVCSGGVFVALIH